MASGIGECLGRFCCVVCAARLTRHEKCGRSDDPSAPGRSQSARAMNVAVKPEAGPTLACPACGRSTHHRFLYSKNGCDILQCVKCHLGRTQASDFDPGAYYTDSYFSGGHPDGYANYLGAESVLRREFAREVAFIRSYHSSGRLIEIGCAYGFFLQEAKRYFSVG